MNKTYLIAGVVLLIVVVGVVAYYFSQSSKSSPTTTSTSATKTTTTTTSGTTTSVTTTSSGKTLTFTYGNITVTATIPTTQVTITGGGATSIYPLMQGWTQTFKNITGGNVVINYQAIGSGAGESNLLSGALLFSGTDVPISYKAYSQLKSENHNFIQVPVIGVAFGIVYNIPGWDEAKFGPLRLNGTVLADIALGKVIYWDDPEIVSLQTPAAQQFLKQIHQPIIFVHRSDGSGSTAIFTMYLSMMSPQWNSTVGYGYTVNWPRDSMGYGQGAKGSAGVAQTVKSTPYSMGYVEYAYAVQNNITLAAIKNKDGYFVQPNATTVQAALAQGAKNLPPPNQYYGNVPFNFINTPGKYSYPLVGTPYITVDISNIKDPNQLMAIKAFLEWMLTEGQKPQNLITGYVPLPQQLLQQVLQYVQQYMK